LGNDLVKAERGDDFAPGCLGGPLAQASQGLAQTMPKFEISPLQRHIRRNSATGSAALRPQKEPQTIENQTKRSRGSAWGFRYYLAAPGCSQEGAQKLHIMPISSGIYAR